MTSALESNLKTTFKHITGQFSQFYHGFDVNVDRFSNNMVVSGQKEGYLAQGQLKEAYPSQAMLKKDNLDETKIDANKELVPHSKSEYHPVKLNFNFNTGFLYTYKI